MTQAKPWALAIVGATATGKSAFGLSVAQALQGEILCMDSMQIYRGMDIGTAKPTAEEQAQVKHHLLDIVSPQTPFSVEDYQACAIPTMQAVLARGKVPILVGGTGLYLRTLAQGMNLGGVKGDEALRAKYNAIATQPNGNLHLHKQLQAVDAQTAQRLHPNDVRRVIRALEVYDITGTPMSEQKPTRGEPPCHIVPIALGMKRETLVARIEKRIDLMFAQGLLQEVSDLLAQGVSPNAQSMQGIGYKECIAVVQQQLAQDEAKKQMVHNTKLYAKRQNTWFRAEPNLQWFHVEDDQWQQSALAFLQNELQQKGWLNA